MTDKPLPQAPEALPVPTTDAHTHLTTTARATGLAPADALAHARAVGVHRVVDVGYDPASSAAALALATEHPEVVATVAIHPHDAVELGEGLDEALREVEALLGAPGAVDATATGARGRIRGVGETGLDHYWVKDPAERARQRDAFATQIGWAHAHDLALVIHDRDAHADLVDVLDAQGWPARVQMHCFSGDAAFARRCLDGGAHLSFPGTVTFKANEHLREALRLTPLDRLLVETDAPYLTPAPLRGRPNASYLLPHTVRFIADVRGVDLAELCAQLDANATALFGDWGTAAENTAVENTAVENTAVGRTADGATGGGRG
ncbi:TatD family hydrolase [Propioniciclava soli]|uniref:TatD family hydrolase n=1 Tax=Propioniciclava soli TaxID=2775081 RepID=A0ABZ3C8V8_9ACTN